MKPFFDINRWKSLLKSWKALFIYAFGDEDRALHEFENCLKLDPKNGSNLVTLGKILVSKENYSEGLERLEEALKYLKDNKSLPEVFAYIAYSYYNLRRLEDAVLFYRKAIDTWIKDSDFKKTDLFYGLGRIYLKQNKYEDAIRVFKKGLNLQNKEPLIYFGLGVAYYETGQEEDSKYYLDFAKSLDPKLKDNEAMRILINELGSSIPIH